MPHKNLGKAPQHAANPKNKSLHESGSSELLDELDALLINSKDEGIDPDALMACLDKLDEVSPLEETFDVKESLQEFQEQHREAFPKKKRRRFSTKARWLVAAVLVALLACPLLAGAFDFNFIEVIAHWTSDVFHFEVKTNGDEPAADIVDVMVAVDKEYPSLQDALDGCGITQKVAPTWIPEGYVLEEVEVINLSRKNKIYARYSKDAQMLSISIQQYKKISDVSSALYEKDRDKVRQYDSHGITYYIMSNNRMTNCVWINGTLAGFIQGELSEGELEQMIDSI